MKDISKLQSQWALIIIQDPNCLPGKSIFNLICILLNSINFKFTIIDDIIGAKTSVLLERENEIMKTNDFLQVV